MRDNRNCVALARALALFMFVFIGVHEAGAADSISIKSNGCQSVTWIPQEGFAARSGWAREIKDAFARIDYDQGGSLAHYVTDWDQMSCIQLDGQPRLVALYPGLKKGVTLNHDWDTARERIEILKAKFPNRHFTALTEAIFWHQYAWNARGSGYANTVTEEGWQLFRERLHHAERILLETKTYSAALPQWYELMIEIQVGLGQPLEAMLKTLEEGVHKYPKFYPIYFTTINYMLPRWGGSWELIDSFVEWAVHETKAEEGNTMYARIYWSASAYLEESQALFSDTKAQWPRMKEGFIDLLARHPNSIWNRRAFLRFSCMAGDLETFKTVRDELQKSAAVPVSLDGDIGIKKCKEKLPNNAYWKK